MSPPTPQTGNDGCHAAAGNHEGSKPPSLTANSRQSSFSSISSSITLSSLGSCNSRRRSTDSSCQLPDPPAALASNDGPLPFSCSMAQPTIIPQGAPAAGVTQAMKASNTTAAGQDQRQVLASLLGALACFMHRTMLQQSEIEHLRSLLQLQPPSPSHKPSVCSTLRVRPSQGITAVDVQGMHGRMEGTPAATVGFGAPTTVQVSAQAPTPSQDCKDTPLQPTCPVFSPWTTPARFAGPVMRQPSFHPQPVSPVNPQPVQQQHTPVQLPAELETTSSLAETTRATAPISLISSPAPSTSFELQYGRHDSAVACPSKVAAAPQQQRHVPDLSAQLQAARKRVAALSSAAAAAAAAAVAVAGPHSCSAHQHATACSHSSSGTVNSWKGRVRSVVDGQAKLGVNRCVHACLLKMEKHNEMMCSDPVDVSDTVASSSNVHRVLIAGAAYVPRTAVTLLQT